MDSPINPFVGPPISLALDPSWILFWAGLCCAALGRDVMDWAELGWAGLDVTGWAIYVVAGCCCLLLVVAVSGCFWFCFWFCVCGYG